MKAEIIAVGTEIFDRTDCQYQCSVFVGKTSRDWGRCIFSNGCRRQ